ncbi:MAG: hypothetical protein ACT4PO_02895, partial [Actinomycetota bacterium]
TASDVRTAAKTTDLVIVSVPAFAHERFVTEILPGLRPGATLLWGRGAARSWPGRCRGRPGASTSPWGRQAASRSSRGRPRRAP